MIKWPKSCKMATWTEINKDLYKIESLSVSELDRMGKGIYTDGVNRFGVVEGKKPARKPAIPSKTRRQKEIDCLV